MYCGSFVSQRQEHDLCGGEVFFSNANRRSSKGIWEVSQLRLLLRTNLLTVEAQVVLRKCSKSVKGGVYTNVIYVDYAEIRKRLRATNKPMVQCESSFRSTPDL